MNNPISTGDSQVAQHIHHWAPVFGETCEHGQLKRQCQVCELQAERDALRTLNDSLRDRHSRLQDQIDILRLSLDNASEIIAQMTLNRTLTPNMILIDKHESWGNLEEKPLNYLSDTSDPSNIKEPTK